MTNPKDVLARIVEENVSFRRRSYSPTEVVNLMRLAFQEGHKVGQEKMANYAALLKDHPNS